MPPLKTHATIDGAKTLADDLHQIYLEELASVTRMCQTEHPASFSDRRFQSTARLWKADAMQKFRIDVRTHRYRFDPQTVHACRAS